MMDKFERLLNLTAILVDTAVPLTAEEIREQVPGYPEGDIAFHRAFERDKDSLRNLGYPIETIMVDHLEVPRAGYTIDKSRYAQSDPGFSADEVTALRLARTLVMFEGYEAGELDAFRKLGGLEDPQTDADPVGSLPITDEMSNIFDAINDRAVVRFDYASPAGTGVTNREIEPLGLTFTRGHWYLSGFDRGRGEMRNFRTDRITGGVDVGEPGAFRPGSRNPELVTLPWANGNDGPVVVRVAIDREPAGAVLVEYPDLILVEGHDDGSMTVELSVTNMAGFFSFMAGFLERAEVVSPPEVRTAYVQWVSDLATIECSSGREAR